MKKLLAALLAVLMLMGVFAVGTAAQQEDPAQTWLAEHRRMTRWNWLLLEAAAELRLDEAQRATIAQIIDEFDFDYRELLEQRDFAALVALMRPFNDAMESFLIENGLMEPPIVRPPTPAPLPLHETLPAFVQWILRWIFFGWIWM